MGSAIQDVRLALQQKPQAMSPACKHSVRKLIPSRNSQALVGKSLDLRQSCFPGAGRVCEATTGVAVRERREPKITPTDPPRFAAFASSERSNEFPGFCCRPGRRARRSREFRRRHARRGARFRGGLDGRIAATALPALQVRRGHSLGRCARLSPLDGIAATVMPALPVRQHHALGRRARPSPLSLRFLRAHIQYPDEDTPREAAQQRALADFRRHDDRAKEHPQKRRGVRGERDDLVPLAQALPRMFFRSARKNSR